MSITESITQPTTITTQAITNIANTTRNALATLRLVKEAKLLESKE